MSSPDSNKLLELTNVSFSYAYSDEPALVDISLSLERGLLYGVVGRNAAGKSTLVQLMRGIIPYFNTGELTGKVTILGRDINDWDPADLSTRIGYVFQNPFTQISGIKDTVFEEIAFGLENLGFERNDIVDRVLQISETLHLVPLLEKDPNGLSGGQRQKVAFASVLAMDSEFVVIDEPTSQLDPQSSQEVFEIISTLQAAGKSIVLVEHKIDLLAEHADRLIVLEAGRLAAVGSAQEVLTSPELSRADVPAPEVTQLAQALAEAGRPLPQTPITRTQAEQLLSSRSQEAN